MKRRCERQALPQNIRFRPRSDIANTLRRVQDDSGADQSVPDDTSHRENSVVQATKAIQRDHQDRQLHLRCKIADKKIAHRSSGLRCSPRANAVRLPGRRSKSASSPHSVNRWRDRHAEADRCMRFSDARVRPGKKKIHGGSSAPSLDDN
jgi:hypothetical protein